MASEGAANPAEIPGADRVVSIFGRWPSFHDAEVVRLVLERTEPYREGPDVLAQIHVFTMTNQVGPSGRYVLTNHTLVSLRFRGADEVELSGFNNQNVLMGLHIMDIRSRQLELLKYEVSLDGVFGGDVHFLCREVVVEDATPYPGREVETAESR